MANAINPKNTMSVSLYGSCQAALKDLILVELINLVVGYVGRTFPTTIFYREITSTCAASFQRRKDGSLELLTADSERVRVHDFGGAPDRTFTYTSRLPEFQLAKSENDEFFFLLGHDLSSGVASAQGNIKFDVDRTLPYVSYASYSLTYDPFFSECLLASHGTSSLDSYHRTNGVLWRQFDAGQRGKLSHSFKIGNHSFIGANNKEVYHIDTSSGQACWTTVFTTQNAGFIRTTMNSRGSKFCVLEKPIEKQKNLTLFSIPTMVQGGVITLESTEPAISLAANDSECATLSESGTSILFDLESGTQMLSFKVPKLLETCFPTMALSDNSLGITARVNGFYTCIFDLRMVPKPALTINY